MEEGREGRKELEKAEMVINTKSQLRNAEKSPVCSNKAQGIVAEAEMKMQRWRKQSLAIRDLST